MATRADRAEKANERLVEATIDRTPNCVGIDLFTADYIGPEESKLLEPICAACNLAILCRQYAELAKPDAGYWAGKRYGKNSRPEAPEKAA